jgi:hypothetical protein
MRLRRDEQGNPAEKAIPGLPELFRANYRGVSDRDQLKLENDRMPRARPAKLVEGTNRERRCSKFEHLNLSTPRMK